MVLTDLIGKLRFFTPDEIKILMSFTKNFDFPSEISLKSRYKLIGNSINVKVVNLLLNYLINY